MSGYFSGRTSAPWSQFGPTGMMAPWQSTVVPPTGPQQEYDQMGNPVGAGPIATGAPQGGVLSTLGNMASGIGSGISTAADAMLPLPNRPDRVPTPEPPPQMAPQPAPPAMGALAAPPPPQMAPPAPVQPPPVAPPPMAAPQAPPGAPQTPPGVLAGMTPQPAPTAAPRPSQDPVQTYLDITEMAESGGRADARNPRSSAVGAFQFIDSTFMSFARANPAMFEGMSQAEILASRNNPAISRQAAQWYAGENGRSLAAAGLEPTPASLGLSHFLGAGGATATLRASPDTPMSQVLPAAAIAANPQLARQTAGQVVAQFQQRYSGAGPGPRGSGEPEMTPAQTPPGEPPADTMEAKPDVTEADPQTAQSKDRPTPYRDGMGMTAENWFAAAGGFFGGRNAMDSMSRGTTALAESRTGTINQNAQIEGRNDDRRFRNQQAAETTQYRRDQLAQQGRLGDGRIEAARLRAAHGGQPNTNVQSTVPMTDPTTGQPYQMQTSRDGTVRVLDAQNNPITDQTVTSRLVRLQDGGEGRRNSAQATADVEATTALYEASTGARALQQSTANLREVLRTNPNITGQSWRAQGSRAIAQALGVSFDGMNPAAVSAAEQALVTGQTQTIMQLAPSLRPLSNVDLQTILRGVPSLLSNPQNLGAWLTQVDQAAQRAERRSGELRALQDDPEKYRTEVRNRGGVSAWRDGRDAAEAAQRNPGGTVQPNIAPAPGGGYQYRSPSGSNMTIQRVN